MTSSLSSNVKEYLFIDVLMPVTISEFLKLPMIRQTTLLTLNTLNLPAYFYNQTISTKEVIDFLKSGPNGKVLLIVEHFLEDGHAELLLKLRLVSLGISSMD